VPFLRVRDVRLHYELKGPETDAGRAPLVLLHGLGSSTRDWRPQVEHFSQKRRVLALDLRGHGRSEAPPGPYAIPLFAGDTADAVRRLLPRATASGGVHVTGLSMGGMVALQLALDAPSVPKSLTVVNAGVDYRPATRRQRRLLWQRRAAMRALSVRQVGWLLGRRLFPGRPALQQKMTDRWAQNDPVAYRASFEAIMGWSARARLPEITAPSLVVAADGDYLPLSVYRTYAGRIPHAELAVLENARHAAPVAQPQAFNAVLEGFLDGF
jgi:pimeloyl-ACP methyl ester carboxylesterase